MALDEIRQAVIQAAKAEAGRIVNAARATAEAKVLSAREAAEAAADKRFQAAVRTIDEECARQLVRARGASGKELLAARRARLNEVMAAARTIFLAMPASEYQAIMQRLLSEAIGDDACQIRIHPEDRAIFAALIPVINAARPAEAALSLDEKSPLPKRGGFILDTGAYEIDRTLDTLLVEMEYELAPRMAAALFTD